MSGSNGDKFHGWCELAHAQNRRGVIRLTVSASRAGRPGRPAMRDYLVCESHGRDLRRLGIGIPGPATAKEAVDG